jgi:putative peptidoglycan lipid II flippase
MTSGGNKQIAKAALVVMFAFVLSRVLGLAREMIVSSHFGTSGELDAYLAAFRIPDILFQIVAGGALASAFLPTFTQHLAQDDEAGAWRLASAIINLVILILSSLALLGAVFAPLLVRYIVAPGFDPARQALTAELMRYMMISTVLFGVSGVVMAILNSYHHFLLPALAPVLYNSAIILGALFLSRQMGIRSLALGVVAGAVLHLSIQLPLLLRRGLAYAPVLDLHSPGVREVGRLMLPRTIGLAIVQLNFLINTILASRLGPGSLAALNYAWLLMLLPQGIFAQAIATAAFPTFSALAARQQHDEMRRTLTATLRAVLYLTIPASLGLFILRTPVTQLLFQRGRFDLSSTEAVAWALQFYALGLFAHATVEIVTRAYYALHDTSTPVVIGVLAMAANIVLSLILVRPMGYAGLALANSLATIAEMSALIVIMRRRLGGIEGKTMALSMGRIAVGSVGMGWAAWEVARLLAPRGVLIQVSGAVLVAGAVYAVASTALGSAEVRTLWSWARNRQRA